MEKRWIIVLAAILMTGCSTEAVMRQTRDAFEQPQMARQQADAAARQAQMLKEQEELKRQLDERKRRQNAAGPQGPQINRLAQDGIDGDPLRDPAAALQPLGEMSVQNSIYYDYDSFMVKQEYHELLEQHAARLLVQPGLQLSVEGNCDERGSREYNLALGQRRADSIKRVLTLLGVPGTQINTVSLGSEKPVSDGGSETDLAKNRRSDLVYPGPATTK